MSAYSRVRLCSLAEFSAQTMFDGDTMFALATGKAGLEDVTILGAIAAEVVAAAIIRAVRQAEGLFGIPAAREMNLERKR